jgi:quercetin dioxygenase-like cupin family protein
MKFAHYDVGIFAGARHVGTSCSLLMPQLKSFHFRIDSISLDMPSVAPKEFGMRLFPVVAVFCTAGLVAGAPAGHARETDAVKVVFQRAIPNVPGKNLVAVVVSYPPGGKSLPHHHAKSAFIYARVLAGAIRSAVGTEPEKVYRTGESFHEDPGADHRVSENASATQPASLLAVFIVDGDDQPLTIPDSNSGAR